MQRMRGRWGIGVGIFLVGLLIYTVVLPWATRPRLNAPSGSAVIVFPSSDPELGGEQVFASTGRGEPPVRVTENFARLISGLPFPGLFHTGVLNRNPHPSSTPGVITFVSNLGGPNELYQIDINGHNQRRLAVPIDDRPLTKLSPDGAWVALIDVDGKLIVRRRDGTDAWCVTCGQSDGARRFAWSPDSQRLAYDRMPGGMFVATIASQDQRQVTASGHAPSWSPDGTHLMFLVQSTQTTKHVATIALDDPALPSGVFSTPQPGVMFEGSEPVWSPDGTRIAFTTRRHDQSDIYVINIDGTGEQRVTWNGRSYDPTWIQIP